MKTLTLVASVLALAGSLVGCASTPQSNARIPFPEAEYAKYTVPGDSTVSGDVIIEQYNASVTHPRDPVHEIFLLPATSYAQQTVDIAFFRCDILSPPDARQEQYVRRLAPITNGSFEAKFEFRNVPAGEYWAVDRVNYKADGSPGGVNARVRIVKIVVAAHQDLRNVKIRTPPDQRHGATTCANSFQ